MLNLEDRLAIQDLYARYNLLLDTGNNDAWSRCFTEDGIFDARKVVRGRAEIAKYGQWRAEVRVTQPWSNPQHWNTNFLVTGDGTAAKATCYLVVACKMKDSGAYTITVQGSYQDECAKVNGQWLFKKRKFHFDSTPTDILPFSI